MGWHKRGWHKKLKKNGGWHKKGGIKKKPMRLGPKEKIEVRGSKSLTPGTSKEYLRVLLQLFRHQSHVKQILLVVDFR